jgi:LacI family transcriptional regulator
MVTMSDIAARVGVSQATVSYVLNNRKTGVRVREEMRQRILQTAAELGYRRNDIARAMASGKNYVFAFVTRIAGEESSNRIMVGAQEEASERGYMIKLLPMPGNADYATAFARLAEQRMAGVMALNLKPDVLECLRAETERFEIPVVLMDDPPEQDWAAIVVSDDHDGLRQGVTHLLELGHKRIGFVSAQRNSPLAERRRESFLQLMAENGLSVPDEHIVSTDWRKPYEIEEKVLPMLAPGRPRDSYPTALLTAGDPIAMVTMRTARSLGYRVPEDLSIVGFADFQCAIYADPALTTVAQPYEEMGRIGARYLLGELPPPDEEAPHPPHIQVPTRLLVRASTASPLIY